jgi:sn-glycerol 3-phosphate transport system substrate-binding protein
MRGFDIVFDNGKGGPLPMMRARVCSIITCALLLVLNTAVVAGPVQVEFWFGEAPKAYVDSMTGIVEQFNAAHPDIHVNLILKGHATYPYVDAMKVAVVGGSSPDLVYHNYYTVKDMSLEGDWFIPLNDLLHPKEIEALDDAYLPGPRDSMKIGSIWYGLPWRTCVRGLLVNIDMFEQAGMDPSKPPRYIDELDAAAQKLAVRDESGEIIKVGFVPTGNNLSRGLPWLWAFGGEFYDYDNFTPALTGAYRERNLEALAWMKSYADHYGTRPSGSSWFRQEKVAMCIDSTTSLANLADTHPELRVAAGVIPTKPDAKLFSTTFPLGPAIPVGARNAKAAVEFIKYLSDPDVQVKWFDETRSIPTTISAFRRIQPRAKDPRERFLIQQMLPAARIMPPFSTDILNIFEPIFNAMRAGRATPLEVLEETQRLAEMALQEKIKTR